jgi:hypothetical protein
MMNGQVFSRASADQKSLWYYTSTWRPNGRFSGELGKCFLTSLLCTVCLYLTAVCVRVRVRVRVRVCERYGIRAPFKYYSWNACTLLPTRRATI